MLKIAPISNYDVAAHQAWLEDEAAKGNILLEHNGFYANFKKGEPKTARYRMEPKMRKGEEFPDLEKREVYGSLGWKHITSNANFHVWCCEDPEAPELNTDPQVQAAAYEWSWRQLRVGTSICCAIVALPLILVLCFTLLTEDYGVRMVRDSTPMWKNGTAWFILLFAFWQILYWRQSLKKFLRTLKAGIAMPRRRPYQKSRVLTVIALVVYIMFLIVQAVNLFEPNSRRFEPEESYDQPVPHVELAEGEYVRAIYWKNWYTAEQWWVLQGVNDYDITESRCYDFHFRWQAERMAHDLVKYYDMVPLSGADIDGAWWMVSERYGYEVLVVWDGKRVVEVTYSEEDSIVEYLDDYAALVSE